MAKCDVDTVRRSGFIYLFMICFFGDVSGLHFLHLFFFFFFPQRSRPNLKVH